jgi:hypothetical protein
MLTPRLLLLLPRRRCYEIRCANMVFTDNYNETIDRRCASLAVAPWHAPNSILRHLR